MQVRKEVNFPYIIRNKGDLQEAVAKKSTIESNGTKNLPVPLSNYIVYR